MSFRVSINKGDGDGQDNMELAANLSRKINTVDDPAAYIMHYSVARVRNGTFPPVEWPPSTTWQPRAPETTTGAPNLFQAATTTLGSTTMMPSMQVALQALMKAKENQVAYEKFQRRLTRATRAHAEGLLFHNPLMTTPIPTREPMVAVSQEEPMTLGRLFYDAFLNTPPPITTAAPTPVPSIQDLLANS